MTLHSVFAVVSPGSGFYFAKKPGYQRRFAELINLMYLACDARAWHEQYETAHSLPTDKSRSITPRINQQCSASNHATSTHTYFTQQPLLE